MALLVLETSNYLLILVGIFSDDMITTGTSFITDDCWK